MQDDVRLVVATECETFFVFLVVVVVFSPYMLTWVNKSCEHGAFGTEAMVRFQHFWAL